MKTNPTLQTKLYGLNKIFTEIINLINLDTLLPFLIIINNFINEKLS